MKTKLFTLISAILFAATSIFAQNTDTRTYSFATAGEHTFTASQAKNGGYCAQEAELVLNVQEKNPVTAVTIDGPVEGFVDAELVYTATAANATQFEWYLDGAKQGSDSAKFIFTPAAANTYSIVCKARNSFSAAEEWIVSATKEVTVSVKRYIIDVLDNAFTGISGTTYTEWSGKTATSKAEYAGLTAGDKSTIKLRSKNSNEGVVTTASGGTLKSITVKFNSATAAARVLDIYADNTAYTAPSELFGDAPKGTNVASFKMEDGASQSYTFTGNYKFLGFRSNNLALSLDTVIVVWKVKSNGEDPNPEQHDVPTVADLENEFDLTSNVVYCIKFIDDAEVCNDVRFVGTANNWGKGDGSKEDWDNCEKFEPLAGFDGWYVAALPYAEGFQGKPLQEPSDRSWWTWYFQCGDVDAWNYVGGSMLDIVSGYSGECDVYAPAAGAYIYELKYWKNHKSPCGSELELTPLTGTFNIGGIEYYLNGTNLTAEVKSNNYSGDIVIPSSVKYEFFTYSVTSIRWGAFSGCSGLTSIEIPNSVTSIGDNAFRGCSSLTSVTIPNSVTSIGNNTFYGCTGLNNIEIPNSVTSIGGGAFSDILNIIYNGTATGSPWGAKFVNCYVEGLLVYSDNSKTTLLACSPAIAGEISIPNSVIGIGDQAFYYCSGLTSIEIPNSVTSIGDGAFYGCSGLTSIEIPNSVTSIGDYAFSGCKGLTNIEIPDGVTSIEDGAFSGCDGLTSIEIPNSVTSIGGGAFNGCTSLNNIEIPNNVTSIGAQAFGGCSGLTSIDIPNSVTSIENWTFSGCSGLTSVTIPNSITNIGDRAFSGCTSLNNIEIPKSVTSIGISAFLGCSSLTSIEIPDGVTSIATSVFHSCTSLESVTIPNSVTSIGDYAFYRCTSLNNIEIPNNVTSIGVGAFRDCSGLTSIEIPNSVTSIGDEAFRGCSGLTSFTNYATIPQTIDEWCLYGVDKSACTLYVLESSIDLYKAADVWKEFGSIVGIAETPTAIDQIESSSLKGGDRGRLILRNSQLLILRDGKTYTITGQEVK